MKPLLLFVVLVAACASNEGQQPDAAISHDALVDGTAFLEGRAHDQVRSDQPVAFDQQALHSDGKVSADASCKAYACDCINKPNGSACGVTSICTGGVCNSTQHCENGVCLCGTHVCGTNESCDPVGTCKCGPTTSTTGPACGSGTCLGGVNCDSSPCGNKCGPLETCVGGVCLCGNHPCHAGDRCAPGGVCICNGVSSTTGPACGADEICLGVNGVGACACGTTYGTYGQKACSAPKTCVNGTCQ